MPLANSKLIPAAFWVGFLMLGLVTSLEGPRHRAQHVARPVKTEVAPSELVAQSEKPVAANSIVKAAARD